MGTSEASSSASREETEHQRRLAFFLIFGAILLAVVAYSFGERQGRREMTSLSGEERTLRDVMSGRKPRTFEERVRLHQDQVGAKLNRQRIRAQHERIGLPDPRDGTPGWKPDSVMTGLPFDGQKNRYDSIVPNGSRQTDSAEADIQSRVQLAKDLEEWEQSAREEYIRQFKANARAMGYEVKIDRDYNVEWQPISRVPQGGLSEPGNGEQQRGGAVR